MDCCEAIYEILSVQLIREVQQEVRSYGSDIGVLIGGSAGGLFGGLVGGPAGAAVGGIVGGAMGLVMGEFWDLEVQPGINQRAHEWDEDDSSITHEMDQFLERGGVTRPRLPSELRFDVYRQLWETGYLNYDDIQENLKTFTAIVDEFVPGGDRYGAALAASPFLYPMMLQSEQQVGEGSLNREKD